MRLPVCLLHYCNGNEKYKGVDKSESVCSIGISEVPYFFQVSGQCAIKTLQLTAFRQCKLLVAEVRHELLIWFGGSYKFPPDQSHFLQ